jgi:CCR4-NOT transcription complex subunit 6
MDHYEKFFRKELDHQGYSSFYACKNPANSLQSDGLCLAWKRHRFHLLHSHTQSFAETMAHLPDATPNIAVFLALEDLATGRRLVVANTHLYWHWDYDSLRAVQAQFLFERLVEWMHQIKLPDAEMIVCGGTIS